MYCQCPFESASTGLGCSAITHKAWWCHRIGTIYEQELPSRSQPMRQWPPTTCTCKRNDIPSTPSPTTFTRLYSTNHTINSSHKRAKKSKSKREQEQEEAKRVQELKGSRRPLSLAAPKPQGKELSQKHSLFVQRGYQVLLFIGFLHQPIQLQKYLQLAQNAQDTLLINISKVWKQPP